MIPTETVTVYRPRTVGADPGNDPLIEWDSEDVEGVLVSPGDAVLLDRPGATRIRWSLHFPKGYPETLRGARISVRGDSPAPVVGDPRHFTQEATPGLWSMPVVLEDRDG